MKIKWFGHACFLMTSESGVSILTDPFDEQVGYPLPEIHADIVTTSHSHFDHNNTQIVKGDFKHVKNMGQFEEDGITITGIQTYHDEQKGGERGINIIYKFDIDGINVCQVGDLGHILSEEQAELLQPVDVLLVPVGGTFTIDYKGAMQVKELLSPSITIPMHYKTDALLFSLDTVNQFLSQYSNRDSFGKNEIEITNENLSSYPELVTLNYK